MELKYTATDMKGERVTAVADIDSVPSLVGRLKKQGLTPLHIETVRKKSGFGLRKTKVTRKELGVFSRQLATILNSGILLTEAMNTIASDMDNHYLQQVIKEITDDINAGSRFSDSLNKYPEIFPQLFISMVKSGEEIGNLAVTMANLAKYIEESEAMREKVKAAIRYPLIVLCFMFVVLSIMVLVIIPKFAALFAKAGAQLPLLTRMVMGVSDFFIHNTLVGLALIGVIWFMVWRLLKVFRIRFAWDFYQLRLPMFGVIIRKVILGRFCRTMSTLLAGGVSIVNSLTISEGVTTNLYLKQVFVDAKNSVISGILLSEALRQYDELPRVLIKMIAVGEKSGKLNDMLSRIADYYEDEVSITLNKLSTMIEPILIIFIGVVVLVVALALYLPIFNLSTALH